ncbi:MAG TPA: hypothetical protein ENG87_00045 [Candidatus Pacearchaeota archaeon]|nr:hypothetical protein BMS3Abin17_00937 [archaeon BMS3Abin17]HDK41741.1 hypothetical protein [Candidatus Pacearchaeota archaeon]HDZ60502.1 hypothetical protein [Candidatus Pacearchaeota archaeon]
MPTVSGIEFLKTIDKKYGVQPWPFIRYLAHSNPELLEKGLRQYLDYDGAENYQAIKEGLRENYINWLVISDINNEKKDLSITGAGGLH